MPYEEIRLTDANRPSCPACEGKMSCTDCDDMRPRAERIYAGCRLLTPLHRWEKVTETERPKFGKMIIRTEESGPVPWRYWPTDRIRFTEPETANGGEPEVRMMSGYGPFGIMHLAATSSSFGMPSISSSNELAHARYDKQNRKWVIVHYPDDSHDHTTIEADSKAKARTALRRLGKEYAKKLGVAFTEEPKQ